MKPFLSVIIPAYNESERLPTTLLDVDRELSLTDYSYEVLVVNDGSSDGTGDVAVKLGGLARNLRLVGSEENRGKGWAVRQGMLEARGSYRLFMDADNSVSVGQFANMLPYFKNGYGVVVGSRAVKGARLAPPQPVFRRIFGKLGNLAIRTLAVPGIYDTQCGFKCFTEEAAVRIFSAVRTRRWAFDVEALGLANLFGFRIKEMPVIWANDARSSFGFKDYPPFLWDVLRFRFRLRRGAYRV